MKSRLKSQEETSSWSPGWAGALCGWCWKGCYETPVNYVLSQYTVLSIQPPFSPYIHSFPRSYLFLSRYALSPFLRSLSLYLPSLYIPSFSLCTFFLSASTGQIGTSLRPNSLCLLLIGWSHFNPFPLLLVQSQWRRSCHKWLPFPSCSCHHSGSDLATTDFFSPPAHVITVALILSLWLHQRPHQIYIRTVSIDLDILPLFVKH